MRAPEFWKLPHELGPGGAGLAARPVIATLTSDLLGCTWLSQVPNII